MKPQRRRFLNHEARVNRIHRMPNIALKKKRVIAKAHARGNPEFRVVREQRPLNPNLSIWRQSHHRSGPSGLKRPLCRLFDASC
ncbi:hypothetical protein HYPGJ_31925 [Hyphomicrobium sp. GJ21]|nr:hypothetical protein HYPGJ_31925 [Hyphomicrobium sp. GJ21]